MKLLHYTLIGLTSLGLSMSTPIEKSAAPENSVTSETKNELAGLKFKSSADSIKCVKAYQKANKLIDDAFDKSDSIVDEGQKRADSLLDIGYAKGDTIWSEGYDYSSSIQDTNARNKYLDNVFAASENYKRKAFVQQKSFLDSITTQTENLKTKALQKASSIKQKAKGLYCKPSKVIITTAKKIKHNKKLKKI